MIWDLVGKVCESPNDKLWNCSSISETNGKLWNQKEPSILPTKLADVGAITISKQLIWHVQQLHKRSSTAKKKVAKLLNTERCESKNLGKHHSISVDWAFTITLSFFFQTTPRWNYQYLPWGWGWWCPTSHPGTRFPVLEPPPGTLQRRSPGESSHSVGCLGISGRCLAGSHGKCLTPVTWSVKREKKSCQRVALHIPWYKILASPDLWKNQREVPQTDIKLYWPKIDFFRTPTSKMIEKKTKSYQPYHLKAYSWNYQSDLNLREKSYLTNTPRCRVGFRAAPYQNIYPTAATESWNNVDTRLGDFQKFLERKLAKKTKTATVINSHLIGCKRIQIFIIHQQTNIFGGSNRT